MTRDGVRLACRDFGGERPPVLMLHGLAGHAREWAETASWLTARCRVVALVARGHGHSERAPVDVSRDAQVADAACVVDEMGLAPVVVVGQSVGGLTAISLAARRPERVRCLVVVEASPLGGKQAAESAAAALGEVLRSWPVPFASPTDAEAFFTERFGGPVPAEAWTRGLEEREDGWWPRFDIEVMVQTLRQALAEPRWDEWERISCPTLVVRAENGLVDPHIAQEMVERLPGTVLVDFAGASHDLHLDQPDKWRQTLTGFLDSLEPETG
jgi:pimeloyl-ACP methyl ester carboxylesterase